MQFKTCFCNFGILSFLYFLICMNNALFLKQITKEPMFAFFFSVPQGPPDLDKNKSGSRSSKVIQIRLDHDPLNILVGTFLFKKYFWIFQTDGGHEDGYLIGLNSVLKCFESLASRPPS